MINPTHRDTVPIPPDVSARVRALCARLGQTRALARQIEKLAAL